VGSRSGRPPRSWPSTGLGPADTPPECSRERSRGLRAVREKESFLLKSTGGKSTPLLRSPPDRAAPPPGRTTPSLAPDTANDAIPRPTAAEWQIRAQPPARHTVRELVRGGVAARPRRRSGARYYYPGSEQGCGRMGRGSPGRRGATCAAEVWKEGSGLALAVHGDGREKREEARRRARSVGPPREPVWRRLPRGCARARRWQRDGDVPWRWGRRRSRTNGWERVPGPPVAAALARVIRHRQYRTYAAGSLRFSLSFSFFFR
jgi:hypothetical protein